MKKYNYDQHGDMIMAHCCYLVVSDRQHYRKILNVDKNDEREIRTYLILHGVGTVLPKSSDYKPEDFPLWIKAIEQIANVEFHIAKDDVGNYAMSKLDHTTKVTRKYFLQHNQMNYQHSQNVYHSDDLLIDLRNEEDQ